MWWLLKIILLNNSLFNPFRKNKKWLLWNEFFKKLLSNIKFKEIVKELDEFIDSNNLVQLVK